MIIILCVMCDGAAAVVVVDAVDVVVGDEGAVVGALSNRNRGN